MPRRHAGGIEQVLDWAAIERARAFAERWHRGDWGIYRLPAHLGAAVIQDDVDPIVLGATEPDDEGGRLIYLHSRLAGQGFVGVLAHECAHPFTCGEGMQFCAGPFVHSPNEMLTNIIASVLAVPADAVKDVHLDDGSSSVVGQALGVPRQMVRVRRSLAIAMGEIPGRRDHALHSLTASTIGLAAYFWRLSNELAASDPTAPYYRPLPS